MTDSVVIQHSIDSNYYTAEAFKEIADTLNYVDSLKMIPEKSTIDKIMAYSKSFKPGTFG